MICSVTNIRRSLVVTTLALLVGICGGSPRADEATQPGAGTKYRLAYKFLPNDVLRYHVVQNSVMTVLFNQAKQIDRHHAETTRNLRVVSVDATGSAEVEVIITHVYLKAQRGENESDEFDSQDPDTRATKYEKYKAIYDSIGQPQARLTLSAAGKVLKFTSLGQFKDAGADTEMVKGVLTHFPEQPVAVGDRWSEEYEVDVKVDQSLKQKVTMLRKFRLAAVEKNVARIEVKTGALTPLTDPTIEAQLIQREFTGTIELDLDRGVIVSRKHHVDKAVVNAFGEQSSLQAVSNYEEKLLPQTAAKTTARQ